MKQDNPTYRFRLHALAAAVGFVSGGVHANEFVVSNLADDGAGSFRQALVSAEGDGGEASTITFSSGLSGAINLLSSLPTLSHSITIEGEGITLKAGGVAYGPVLDIDSNYLYDEFIVRGLTITGSQGGAIDANLNFNGASLVLDSVSVTGNVGDSAVAASYGDVEIVKSVISGNRSEGADGAGVDLRYANLTLVDSKIIDNDTVDYASGGGINADNYSSVTIERSVISGNRAGRSGGGIRFSSFSADMTITDSTISGNTATMGGGIDAYIYSGELRIERSSISDNTAVASESYGAPRRLGGRYSRSGGISFNSGWYGNAGVVIHDSVIQGNSAEVEGGLGVDAQYVDIRRALIRNNQAADYVGGFSIYADNVDLFESVVTGNRAPVGAAGFINAFGGGASYLNIVSTTISNHGASDEGVVLGVFMEQAQLTIANSTVSGNTAYVQPVMIAGYSDFSAVEISNSTFSGNRSTGTPSAIQISNSDTTIINSTFVNNAATMPSGAEGSTAQVSFHNTGGDQTDLDIQRSVLTSSNDVEVQIGGQEFGYQYSYSYGGEETFDFGGNNYTVSYSLANVIMTNGVGVDIESDGAGTGTPTEVNPALAALGYRGGFTLVHEPGASSPAIDAGGEGTRPNSRDQRALIGTVADVDLGSVEVVDNTAPRVITPVGSRISGVLGTDIPSFNVADLFTDDDGDMVEAIEVSGLPAGLTYSNGTISGTLDMQGTYHVTVVVMDDNVLPLTTVEQVVVTIAETAARRKKDDGFLGSIPAGALALFGFLGLMRRRAIR